MSGAGMFRDGNTETGGDLAMGWLTLATAAVAASSMFAILIVLARVPGIGAAFPGTDFYRVALTLHVTLSQWVWFMAFAGALWSLSMRGIPSLWHWTSLALAVIGAVAIALSPALGALKPLMSNYFPVLDSGWFFFGLGTSAMAVLFSSGLLLAEKSRRLAQRGRNEGLAPIVEFGCRLAAAAVFVAVVVTLIVGIAMPEGVHGIAYFETLFWGGGHIWQFCLTTLMVVSWLSLSGAQVPLPGAMHLRVLLVLGIVPAMLSPLLLLFGPGSQAYFLGFTRLMQWTSWQVPLGLGAFLLWQYLARKIVPDVGISLSYALLVCGVLLGIFIQGQTTLVTAHYHGTIGAVTLAFMAMTYPVLRQLGCLQPSRRAIGVQLRMYGYGILMMMFGLAGAGLMGAPRKMAGNVGMELSVEALARMVLGLGGALATAGILMFLVLVMRQIWPGVSLRMLRHG